MTDTISNEELLARYEALCAASDRHANDGWRSSHEDGLKRSLTITAAQLDHFADMVIGGIGFEPIKDFQGAEAALSGPVAEFAGFTQEQSDSYAGDLRALLRRAEGQLAQNPTVHREEWLKTACHDGVVGGVKAQVNLFGRQVAVSQHTIRTSMRAFRLRRMLGHVPRCVLEIGGGHGKFVRDILMIAPQTRIVYCDLVFNLLLAGRYLTRMFGDAVHLAWDDAEPIPSEAKILLLPPWRLSEIPLPDRPVLQFHELPAHGTGERALLRRRSGTARCPGDLPSQPDGGGIRS
jgi:putative sugar O-methyltransferase